MARQPDVDRELVDRAQAGDLGAFEELVRKHQGPLYGYVYRMLGNRDEAEELVQVALVQAWKHLGGFRGNSSFKTWLYRIATNRCINKVTRRKPTVELPETLVGPESEEPAQEFRRHRREELVRGALDRLPGDQRAALVMATWEDMSYKDIGRAMGRSARAVDSLLFRARQNLKKLLEPARERGEV
ncbi:RNA polymerase sigma factor [candidate division WOR-3 bacterium]|nr:RNA polymerase sigma factor [candidate division WOR-3 bacterium]